MAGREIAARGYLPVSLLESDICLFNFKISNNDNEIALQGLSLAYGRYCTNYKAKLRRQGAERDGGSL
jgi:hypothetical protein